MWPSMKEGKVYMFAGPFSLNLAGEVLLIVGAYKRRKSLHVAQYEGRKNLHVPQYERRKVLHVAQYERRKSTCGLM